MTQKKVRWKEHSNFMFFLMLQTACVIAIVPHY